MKKILAVMASFFVGVNVWMLSAHAQVIIKTFDGVRDQVLCKLLGYMFQVFMILSVVMVIYAAYLYVSARGEAEQVTKAHKTLTYAVVAIMVALLANAFPSIVSSLIGGGVQSVCP